MTKVYSESNGAWRGEAAGSASIHRWVAKRKLRPELCIKCNQRKAIDLANVSDSYNPLTYTRDLENWEWLCRRCHMLKDGRMENLKRGLGGSPNPNPKGSHRPKEHVVNMIKGRWGNKITSGEETERKAA